MKKIFALASLVAATQALAIPILVPSRCAHDSLGQWSEGQALAGTARGRNEWLKVCDPRGYKITFPGGYEFDPNAPARRVYATFGIVTGLNANREVTFRNDGYVAPTTPPASAADPSCTVPGGNDVVGLCTSGCVTPDSVIASAAGNLEIGQLSQQTGQEVIVPIEDQGSSLIKVRNFIKDMIPSSQSILKITTKSKGTIRVSKNHPLLNGEHYMVPAESLKVGEALVSESGKQDEIIAIEEVKYVGKLHNLTVDSNKLDESLYVAQGFISGDKKFQDIEVSELNRAFLRKTAFKSIQQ